MDKEFVKAALTFAGIGGAFGLCSGILGELLNRRVIKPKDRQQDTDLTMLCGGLAGIGGTFMGLGIGAIVTEAFDVTKEVV